MESEIGGLCARHAIRIISFIFRTAAEGRDFDSYPDFIHEKTDPWHRHLVLVTSLVPRRAEIRRNYAFVLSRSSHAAFPGVS